MRVTIRDVKVICCAPQKINLVTVKVETSEPGLYAQLLPTDIWQWLPLWKNI